MNHDSEVEIQQCSVDSIHALETSIGFSFVYGNWRIKRFSIQPIASNKFLLKVVSKRISIRIS